jgi:hypothetical protein
VRFAIDGTLPADVMPPAAIQLVYALDLALLAAPTSIVPPLLCLVAVLVLLTSRDRSRG